MKKRYGFVLDFVGILSNLEKALAFDSDEVGSVIKDIAILKQLFAQMMKVQAQEYLKLLVGKMDDKTVERVVEYFGDKKHRDAFIKFYRELEMLYEIISPDKFLAPHIENFGLLSWLFKIIRNAFAPPGIIDRDFVRKTANLVRERVGTQGLDKALPLYEINEHLIEELKKRHASKTVQVINLIRTIRKHILDNKDDQPYLIDIGERAEAVLKLFENRQISTEKALEELANIVKKITEAKQARDSKKLDIQSFTTFWVLKEQGLSNHEALSRDISKCFAEHPNWACNATEERDLKATLYALLAKTPLGDKMFEIVPRLLQIQSEMSKRIEKPAS